MIIGVWLFQILFGQFIIRDALNNGTLEFTDVPRIRTAMVRFITGMIMHISCNYEILNGMKMMKFSINHFWKFYNYRLAFLSGFLQVAVMVMITIINYLVIQISESAIDICKDFFALMIVADFDDIFGQLSGAEELPKQITSDAEYRFIFTIETTTSSSATGESNEAMKPDWVFDLIQERRNLKIK